MTIFCNICNQEFPNRSARDTHKKSTCQLNVRVKKSNGEELVIEKMNGKFTCLCETSVTHTDNFQKHWKKCQIQGWIHLNQRDTDNRNNIEKKDLRPSFDG